MKPKDIPLVGGPLDGWVMPVPRDASYVWVETRGEKPRAYRTPLRGRVLYRVSRGRAVFAEFTHVLCRTCGGMHKRRATCTLCGAPLRARSS